MGIYVGGVEYDKIYVGGVELTAFAGGLRRSPEAVSGLLEAFAGSSTQVGSAVNFGISPAPGSVGDLAIHPRTGVAYFVTEGNPSLYSVDLDTGVATLIGSVAENAKALAIHPRTGVAYLAGYRAAVLYIVNLATGALTRVGTATRFGVNEDDPSGLAIHPTTFQGYMVGQRGNFYSLDLATV